MCDDDWETDAPTTTEVGSFGVVDGGTKFSSGRGFVPAERNGSSSGWGGNSKSNGFNNAKSNDDGWGDTGGTGGGADDGWGDSGGDSNQGFRGRGRGGRGGGRGRGGDRGGRGGRGGFRGDDGDRGDRGGDWGDRGDRDGGERRGRGGRGGGRGGSRGGDRENGFGDDGGGGFEGGNDGEPEKKREFYCPQEKEDEEELFNSGITSGVNFMKFEEIEVNVSGNDPPKPITSFQSSGLREHLLENVKRSGYTKLTPIQKYSIPAVLSGRDLMGCAQTGSGKTAAFLLPIINHLLENKNSPVLEGSCSAPNVVIVSPTRELAIQINEQARKFASNSTVKVNVVYGGTSTNHQRNKVLAGAHIVVATPGRLRDFVNRGILSFAECKFFVLDEADRMLDMGFLPVVEEMMRHPSMPATGERQTLMFSATFPEEIQLLAAKFLHNYIFLTVGIVGSASTDVEQLFFQVGKFEKRNKLIETLKENPNERTLIFVETKRSADFLASFLSERDIQSTSIHGDRLQSEREQALEDFKTGRRNILVATGVAARGLDIKNVQHVINYDLPNNIDEYVHRIGRTGRVGNRGRATSFFDMQSDQNLASSLARILSQARQEIPEWLGSAGHGGSSDQFGGRDIRGDDFGKARDFTSAPVANDDEEW